MKHKLSALLICLSMTLLLVGCGGEYKSESEMKKAFKGQWSSYTTDGYIKATMDIGDDSIEYITSTTTSTTQQIDEWDTKEGYLIVGDYKYYINPSGNIMEETTNTEFYKGASGEYYFEAEAEAQQAQDEEETEERIRTLTSSFKFSDTMLYNSSPVTVGGDITNRTSTDYNNVIVLVGVKGQDGSYIHTDAGNIGSVPSGQTVKFTVYLSSDFDFGLAHGYDLFVYDADQAQ